MDVMECREPTLIAEVVERLTRKFPAVPPTTVATLVCDIHARYGGRPLRDFVPLFVERNARSELAKLSG